VKVFAFTTFRNVIHLPVIAAKARLHRAFEGEMNSRLRGNAKFWQLARILSQSQSETGHFAASITAKPRQLHLP
jgi:hypothetical protein